MQQRISSLHLEILTAVDSGESMASVGHRHGIKPDRVKRILVKTRERLNGIASFSPALQLVLSDSGKSLEELGRMSDRELRSMAFVGPSVFREIRALVPRSVPVKFAEALLEELRAEHRAGQENTPGPTKTSIESIAEKLYALAAEFL